jgi:hypothetical protein
VNDGSRLLFFVLWGGGVLVAFSIVLYCRWKLWKSHRDKRSFRDVLEAVGLWLVAAPAASAIGVLLVAPDQTTARGFLNAIALGAFVGVGLIMATDAMASVKKDRTHRR